jgi:hypothetical protein
MNQSHFSTSCHDYLSMICAIILLRHVHCNACTPTPSVLGFLPAAMYAHLYTEADRSSQVCVLTSATYDIYIIYLEHTRQLQG